MEKEDFNAASVSPKGLSVRQAYCTGMRLYQGKRDYGKYIIPQYDGGVSQSGRKYGSNVWDKIADTLEENEIDIDSYVDYVFSSRRSIQGPNILTSPEVIKDYKEMLLGESKPSTWEFEENALLAEIVCRSYSDSIVDAYRLALLDNNIPVSPLTRFAYGRSNEVEEVRAMVEPLKEAAWNQYRSRRFFYDRYYKDKIPEEFKERIKNEGR